MLKKQRLAAMEGKHHDAKPRYTRKGRTSAKDSYDADAWKAWGTPDTDYTPALEAQAR